MSSQVLPEKGAAAPVGAVTAAEIFKDPDAALAKLRAEIRADVLASNVVFAVAMLLWSEHRYARRNGGGGLF